MLRRPTFKGRRQFKSTAEVGQSLGFRSGLEERVAAELEEAIGKPVPYESTVIKYTLPLKERRYTADFLLPNGIIVETKGRFVTADRQKHLAIKEQHPDKDIRFVFSNPNTRISKQSRTTYAAWCDTKGFKYAKGSVPKAWLDEAGHDA